MKFLCVLCALCSLAFGLDREAFTFTSYNLDVRIEPDQQRIGVRGKITLRNDSAVAQKNAVLQISSTLDWKTIQLDGKPVQFLTQPFASDIDHTGSLSEAIVSLPREVAPKGTLELEIGYEGVIPLDSTRLTRIGIPADKGRHSDWDQIGKSFTAVRGIGHVAWYPVATEAASMSEGSSVPETVERWIARESQAALDFKLKSTTGGSGQPPSLLCTGTVKNPIIDPVDPLQQVSLDCSLSPLGSTVPTLVIANYQQQAVKETGAVYYLAGQDDAATDYADVASQISAVVPAGRGSRNLRILALPDADALSFATADLLLVPLKPELTNQAELDIVYALARQSMSSPRPWIQDGLAHFAQAEFIETQKGRDAALDYLQGHRAALVEAEKPPGEHPGIVSESRHSLINSPDDLYLQIKSMCVWWMLKDMQGDLPRAAALDYNPAEDKDPAYMQHLMEKRYNRDWQWFFDDWVYYDRGLPDFRIDSVFYRPLETGGFLVTITIENLGNAGAEVPLNLQMQSSEIRKRIEVRSRSKASLRIETASPPTFVTVNDGSVPESDISNNTYKIEPPNH